MVSVITRTTVGRTLPSIDDNYVFEDLRGNGRQPKERWTYVFTNADYDAAEAMVPFE